MNYYIGDLHLFNRNQTDEGRNYDRRPFATVEEMNQYILERWNAKINNGDTVYILGDTRAGCPVEGQEDFVSR